MSKMIQLWPVGYTGCAFCGASQESCNVQHVSGIKEQSLAVVCKSCGAIGPAGKSILEAREKFNKRFAMPESLPVPSVPFVPSMS